MADLLIGTPSEIVIADKGFWGRDHAARLAATGTTLLAPNKTCTVANLGRERALASTRLKTAGPLANLGDRRASERPKHAAGSRVAPVG